MSHLSIWSTCIIFHDRFHVFPSKLLHKGFILSLNIQPGVKAFKIVRMKPLIKLFSEYFKRFFFLLNAQFLGFERFWDILQHGFQHEILHFFLIRKTNKAIWSNFEKFEDFDLIRNISKDFGSAFRVDSPEIKVRPQGGCWRCSLDFLSHVL